MPKNILVLLAGSGAKDGAEIQEAVLTLLAIKKEGCDYTCASLNKNQKHVLNFIDNTELDQERNMMVEAARISRGQMEDIASLSMKDFDALVLPGGYGVAKNFCTFAFEGTKASVEPEVKRIIQEAYDMKKPIGAICIAPALVALALAEKNHSITMTLGTQEEANKNLTEIGVKFKSCPTSSHVVDEVNRIVSSPAYMHGDSSIVELEEGISKCVKAVIEMTYSKSLSL
jgi:enhancing lycopene biosynthesis protein 2